MRALALKLILLLSIVRLEGADALSTWHLRYVAPTSDFDLRGIAFGNGVFVAPMLSQNDSDSASVLRSSNGIVWTRHLPLGATPGDYGGKFEAGRFFFPGAVSSDGLVWTLSEAPFLTGFAFNGSYFIGDFSASTNGTDWSGIPVPSLSLVLVNRGIGTAFGAGLFVTGGSVFTYSTNNDLTYIKSAKSLILTSPDGFLWTYQREAAGEWIQRVLYGNGRFVAWAYPNFVYPYDYTPINLVSLDGVSWDVVSNVPPAWKYVNGHFLGSVDGPHIATSEDAYSWMTNSFVPNRSIIDITFGAGTYIALARNYTNGYVSEIWQSDPVTNSPPAAPALAVAAYPGLTITGTAGRQHRIEYRDALATNGAWNVLTNVVLPSSPWLYFDREPFAHPGRFYRAVAE